MHVRERKKEKGRERECVCMCEREDLINKSKIYFKPRGRFMMQSWKLNDLEP
jgi:hypothetical protein